MIIKIIPETDAEKSFQKEVEHRGVREFFIFGNKKDIDKDTVDFHDWSGSYRYLLGSLHYFHEVVNDERMESADANKSKNSIPELRIHTVKAEKEDQEEELTKKTMVKRGSVSKPKIQPIDVSNLTLNGDFVVDEEDGEKDAFEDKAQPPIVLDADAIEREDGKGEGRPGLRII